uniref:Uncharacterized protein n=1 Tax=Oryza barthii TaxID=65489 RepID=A0A0D3HJ57_9ORYZ
MVSSSFCSRHPTSSANSSILAFCSAVNRGRGARRAGGGGGGGGVAAGGGGELLAVAVVGNALAVVDDDDGDHREELRGLLRLFPIWVTCIIYTVIFSQSSTFFTKQAATLDRRIGESFKVPPAALQTFIRVTNIAFIPVYDRAFVPVARRFTRTSSGITMPQRINKNPSPPSSRKSAAGVLLRHGRRQLVMRVKEEGEREEMGGMWGPHTVGF